MMPISMSHAMSSRCLPGRVSAHSCCRERSSSSEASARLSTVGTGAESLASDIAGGGLRLAARAHKLVPLALTGLAAASELVALLAPARHHQEALRLGPQRRIGRRRDARCL